MSERARALEQALRELTAMVRGECPSLLNEDSGGNGDLSCQIEKLLAVDPPPSGASPQAETSANVRALTVHICDDCLNLRGEMCNEPGCRFCRRTMAEVAEYLDALLIRPRIDGVSVLIDEGTPLPSPVSPVEPESSSFEANTASNLLQKVELSTLDRYRNTNQMDVDTWMVRAVASSEPRSEDDLVLLDHVIALLKPTVEPEPCVWREKYNELLFAVERAYPGESRHETALRYIREKETVESCAPKAPLKVEREP